MRILEWRAGVPVEPKADLATALDDPTTLVWVDLAGAAPDVLEGIARQLGLDPRTVEDALTPGARPRTTRRADRAFVTCHASELGPADEPAAHQSRVVLRQVSAFVLPHGLLTIRPDGAFAMDEVIRQISERPGLVEAGPAGLLHALLDVVVDGHFSTIQALDDMAEEVEEQLFAARVPSGRAMQKALYRLHKELVQLRRAVLPMREVVATLMRLNGDRGPLAGDYADLYDHVIRAAEWTESLRDMVNALFETNVSLLDARLNEVMKKLAGWAAVIAVPTAITGWFGQNVPFPGFADAVGLWLSVLLIVGVTAAVYAALRRHDWI